MKKNCWLVLGTMLATAAVAQVNTNKLPEIPAPATLATPAPVVAPVSTNVVVTAPTATKPVVKHKKKKVVKKISEPTVALTAGPATVMSQNLNVRGQAGLKGEVISHLKAGDTVNVIAQINLDKHTADEPAQWAKISLPTETKVWVNTKYVDATTKTVIARKLNLRAGPGENYSVLGMIEKGTPVTEVSEKGAWSQIETPTNAFAYVAAMYLKQEAAPAVEVTNAAPAQVETPVAAAVAPTTNTVAEAAPIVTQPPVTSAAPVTTTAAATAVAPVTPPTDANQTTTTVAANTAPAVTDTNAAAPAVVDTNATAAATVDTNPPPPRVVSHEGYVRGATSIVAPTSYELYDSSSGNTINYLYSPTTNLDLSLYNSYQVIVSGEEGISARWKDTPVLTIQKIYVVSTNPPEGYKRVYSPHALSNKRR